MGANMHEKEKVKKRVKIHRAVFLLFLLKANNNEPIIGITRLEKLLFLIREEILKGTPLEGDYYVFEPYKYGPFSTSIFDDVQLMEDMGYMSKEELKDGQTIYSITKKGIEKVDSILERSPDKLRRYLEEIQNKITAIKKDKNSIPLRKLLAYVYQKYPDFAINSEIRDRIPYY